MFGFDPFLLVNCEWEIELAVREPDKSYLSMGLTMVKKQSLTKQVMFDVCAVDENGNKHYNVKDWSNVFMIKPRHNMEHIFAGNCSCVTVVKQHLHIQM